MQRRFPLAALFVILLWQMGCIDHTSPGTALPAATPADRPTASPVASPIASSVVQMPIALSMGVALAQTGPEGTMMGFHVEYVFAEEKKTAAASEYVWVVERARGKPWRKPCVLGQRGELSDFAQGWRPEDGPFHSHIEDVQGNRVSDSIELQ